MSAPTAGPKKLLRERFQVAARVVPHLQRGVEPNFFAGFAKTIIKFPVLSARETLVESADALQGFALKNTEIHRVGGSGMTARVEWGRANAERARQRPGNGFAKRVRALPHHHSADIGGPRFEHHTDSFGNITIGQDAAAAKADRDVEASRVQWKG